jgi:outer membrane usher protein
MRRITPRSAKRGRRGGIGGGVSRAAAILSAALLACGAGPALAKRDDGAPPPAEKQYQKPVSSRLNTTGRAINMSVPLKDDGGELGDLVVLINSDDSVVLPKAALVDKLTPVLDKTSLERLHGVPDVNGQVTIGDLAAAGFNMRFDPAALELVFLPSADERPVGDISLARRQGPASSANAVKPATVSGYLNVTSGLDYLWGDASGAAQSSLRFDLESVTRVWDVVLENEFTVEDKIDAAGCFVGAPGAACVDERTTGFKRRRSRLVYDLPDDEIRIQAGDADVYGTGYQSAPDILGVTVEKSPRKLRPGENIRATGKSSFRIERPSDVEVLVNGAISQKLRLRAGNYNLSDLPLATGANEVQLIITDDTGERRTLAFTTFFDGNLLGEGKHEWSATGGVGSDIEDNERQYHGSDYFGSGFVRYGLTDQATGEVHLQGSRDAVMGGLGVFGATPWGLLGVQGALSDSPSGLGWVAEIDYDLVNFEGPLALLMADGKRESLRLGAEYRTGKFSAPAAISTTATGAPAEPETDYTLRFSASYSVPLPKNISMSLGARYQIDGRSAGEVAADELSGDRYGIDLTLSAPLSERATGSLTFGYANESYLATDTSADSQGAYQILARVFFRPDEETHISSSYDTQNKQTNVNGARSFGQGLDAWNTSLDAEHNGGEERASVSGAVSYLGNRGEVDLSHSAGFDGASLSHFSLEPTDQRSSLRVGTALAFADGKLGIGQPIRGNGFAIVYPHENIGDKTVTVGTGDDVRARTDWLGPAVVPDVPAYSASSIPIDVADLPVGYSLGSGAFDTFAPYKAGYRLEVGSAYSVSAYGTLLNANGEPVALLTGIAHPDGNKEKQVAIFTNGAGKFGAEGLAPGKWIIEMATEGAPTLFAFEIPAGTDGLFKAGELKPAGGV